MTQPLNSISFHTGPSPDEVIRIDAKGFHYRGHAIADELDTHLNQTR